MDAKDFVPMPGRAGHYIGPDGQIMVCRSGQTPAELIAEMEEEAASPPPAPPPPPIDLYAELEALKAEVAAMKPRLDRLDPAGTPAQAS